MSRAFVKEDSEDLMGEELPERPVSPEPNYVTPEGMEQLRGKVEALQAEHVRLKQAAEAFGGIRGGSIHYEDTKDTKRGRGNAGKTGPILLTPRQQRSRSGGD